ncbi:MAG TPA: 2Fe-2S iron-sulfur cluster-binding protein [Pyrinomonadaceae bacterium]|jgi:ferredoxin|nr:2Fe-2S iron-sulfur cluster-binding protein [Pyrinomonadaceae bacterium]
MPQIKAETANGEIAFEAEAGTKLVLAIEDQGIDILHRCGGNARCTTCRVEVVTGDPGPIGEAEAAILSTKTDLNERTRLSCQIRIADDLTVKVINQASVMGIDAGPRPADVDTP